MSIFTSSDPRDPQYRQIGFKAIDRIYKIIDNEIICVDILDQNHCCIANLDSAMEIIQAIGFTAMEETPEIMRLDSPDY
jgi:hypothetical protein